MTRRNNPDHRCVACLLHRSLCLCADLPRLATRTRLVVVLHRDELRKPTNTGRLAARCLEGSEVVVRGNRTDAPFDAPHDRQAVLLFPHDDAVPLDRLALDGRPVTLVVPDGTWRQAGKMRQRMPGLASLACAALPAGAPTTYRLRGPHEGGLATLEAIARALRVLEGEPVERALLRVFAMMVERTLWARGRVDAAEVTGGVPAGTRRHDPGGASG